MKRYSRRESKRTQNRVHLPEDLIIEILLRLPVKYLLRFKSVCKSWLSLISDPHFAILHFELAAASTERLAFSEPFVPEIRSIDFNASLHDDSASALLKLNFLPQKPFYVRIQGSCRGFLLLNYNRSLCVWNPSTGIYRFIDRSPIFNKGYVFIRGFGYDPSTDDYLVVQSVYNPHGRVTRVEYFSLRANTWKEIEAIHFSYKQTSNHLVIDTGLFLYGAIHWLSFCYDISIHVIVAFDLKDRTFSEIPLPIDFVYGSFKLCLLRVLGELLNLCAVRSNHSAEIWTMKEYKVQSSWTKTIVVSVCDFPTKYFFPMCTTKSGDIVGRDVISVLVKCNDKGQLQEHRYYGNGPCTSQVVVYTESLLSLPCDSERAS